MMGIGTPSSQRRIERPMSSSLSKSFQVYSNIVYSNIVYSNIGIYLNVNAW
jgi:hypothetical protein